MGLCLILCTMPATICKGRNSQTARTGRFVTIQEMTECGTARHGEQIYELLEISQTGCAKTNWCEHWCEHAQRFGSMVGSVNANGPNVLRIGKAN